MKLPIPSSLTLRSLCVAALLGLALPVGAQDGAQEGDAPDVGDTVSGKRPPELAGEIAEAEATGFRAKLQRYEGREYEPIVYYGAEALDLTPEFVHEARQSIELMYKRDYPGAQKAFATLERKYKGYGIGAVGQVLVWQALMIENFDFQYESQYQRAYQRARQELEEALQRPGREGWENFLLAGMLGIDSIHAMRHEEYLKALNRGYEALKAVRLCKEAAPDFHDTQLGDGLFNYWATVISMSSKLIPDTGDKRQKGIEQMMLVEQQAVFLVPPATLALAFTWIEEGKYREALKSSTKLREKYPNSVINNLVLGRVQMYLRNYSEAEKIYKEVAAYEPDNMRVHYYLGRLYSRWGKRDKADASFDTYLAFDRVNDYDRAVAYYYKGNLQYRKKNWDKAEEYYKMAWRLAKLEKAKRKLERVKEKKKGG